MDVLTVPDIVGIVAIVVASGGAVWTVATMRQILVQLIESVEALTKSVDRLAERVDALEDEHAATRERLATLEQSRE